MTFKFQIGDLVVPITVMDERLTHMSATKEITACGTGRIVERNSQECTAGIQLAYVVEGQGRRETYAEGSLVSREDFMRQWLEIVMALPQLKEGKP